MTKKAKGQPYPSLLVLSAVGIASMSQITAIVIGTISAHRADQIDTLARCSYSSPLASVATIISVLGTVIVIWTLFTQAGKGYLRRTLGLVFLAIVFAIITLIIAFGSNGDKFLCGYQF